MIKFKIFKGTSSELEVSMNEWLSSWDVNQINILNIDTVRSETEKRIYISIWYKERYK